MAISFPHFLGADPAVRNSVVGMMPDEEKHSSHILVEPVNIAHYLHIAGICLSGEFVLGRSRCKYRMRQRELLYLRSE